MVPGGVGVPEDAVCSSLPVLLDRGGARRGRVGSGPVAQSVRAHP